MLTSHRWSELKRLALESYGGHEPSRQHSYRDRTRVERQLFLVMKEFCEQRLQYHLPGLTAHHRTVARAIAEKDEMAAGVIEHGFRCHALLLAVSPTHPSSRGNHAAEADVQSKIVSERLLAQIDLLGGGLERLSDA